MSAIQPFKSRTWTEILRQGSGRSEDACSVHHQGSWDKVHISLSKDKCDVRKQTAYFTLVSLTEAPEIGNIDPQMLDQRSAPMQACCRPTALRVQSISGFRIVFCVFWNLARRAATLLAQRTTSIHSALTHAGYRCSCTRSLPECPCQPLDRTQQSHLHSPAILVKTVLVVGNCLEVGLSN